jgi:hypothetical protein
MIRYTADSYMLGAPGATIEACARVILAKPHGGYSESDVAHVIVPAYFAVCLRVSLDPLLLIAQMIHETGNLTSWWSQRERRNPAGIGVTGMRKPQRPARGDWQKGPDGQWWAGCVFASWADDAIPAHAGRILAYVFSDAQLRSGPPSLLLDSQAALIETALALRPLPSSFRGMAPTLRGLNRRWAYPGQTYAQQVARVANTLAGV